MPATTLALGAALIVLGVGGYLLTGAVSITALIPAFFGVVFVVAGVLARRDRWRMHAMHAAVLVAILGFIGSARGLPGIPKVLDGTATRPAAIVSQSFMALLTLVYIVLAVRSFISARRARRAAGSLLLVHAAASLAQAADIHVMSYNIKHGQTNAACTQPAATAGQPPAPDCNLDLQAAIAVIREHRADIVGVQEVDRFWARSAYADQPELLAAALGMQKCYAANLQHPADAHADRPHQYGTLILSRFPIMTCGNTLLPRASDTSEQRGFTLAMVDVDGVPLRVYNTHLHTVQADRLLQTEVIAAALDVATGPAVVVGDFNATPASPELKALAARMVSGGAQGLAKVGDPPTDAFTSPARPDGDPKHRIDYVWARQPAEAPIGYVLVDPRTRMASDHYPVLARIRLPAAAPKPTATLVSSKKIWDAGAHNAFTDLIRWRNRWFCTFREGDAHIGGDGKIRVLTSADGDTWTSSALVGEPGIDLRDPKMSVTPDDRLMIVVGGSVYEGTTYKGRQPRVLFSADGSTWSAPERILAEGDWLWRVTWHDGTAYGVTYRTTPAEPTEWAIALVSSHDGRAWNAIAPLDVAGRPNETTLRFMPDGEMVALVRREAGSRLAWIGRSRAPYTAWTWRETAHFVGGPNFIRLPDGQLWASGRSVAGKPATVVARMTFDGGYEPALTLPSGGDTSYAGMVWHDGTLWISYYASHEGKTSIYLAKVQLPA